MAKPAFTARTLFCRVRHPRHSCEKTTARLGGRPLQRHNVASMTRVPVLLGVTRVTAKTFQ